MRILSLIALSALFSAIAVAQDESAPEKEPGPRPVPPAIASMQKPIQVQNALVLKGGTAIALRLVTGIKAKKARVGDVADFVLDHDLWQGEMLIAKEDAPVEATVVEASKAKWISRGSKLGIDIQGLRLLNGQTVSLRGTSRYRGEIGPGAQVTGGLASEALNEGCILCEFVLLPATVISLAAPGNNKNIKANTVATAWTDGDTMLNIESLRAVQPAAAGQAAQLRFVRGHFGAFFNRDLYCNGVPLAHMPTGRKLDIELQPGWYRFAINPKQAPLELFLQSGTETRLISDSDQVYVINTGKKEKGGYSKGIRPDRSLNTESFNPFKKHKSEREYLESAKPIDATDRYPTECHPLAEEASQPAN